MSEPTRDDPSVNAAPAATDEQATPEAESSERAEAPDTESGPYDNGEIPESVDEYAAERGGYGVSTETG